MKFRDPKTGEVFEDIGEAHSRFCGSADSGKRCDECPLDVSRTGYGCISFCNAHPAEAALRMGYEVVEDHIGDVAQKVLPRICEVLGVEVGEVFTADTPYGRFQRCVIDEEGQILNTGTNVLCYMLNHPDRIIRAPRFTEEEVADAKVLMRALRATGLKRNRYEDIYATSDTTADTLLDSEMFPSLRPGQAVRLEEVVM